MQHGLSVKTISATTLLLSVAFLGASCSSKADGGVFFSSDIGETWEQRVFVGQEKKKVITIDALNVENIFFDPLNADVVYLASTDSGLFKSTTVGEQWSQLPLQRTRIRDIGINPVNTQEIFATVDTSIQKTIDGGEHWETVYTDPRSATILRVEPDWENPSRVYASTSTGNVLVSTDSGVTWTTALEVNEPITDIQIDPLNSAVLYAVELDKNIHKSTDRGITWTALITEKTEWNELSTGFPANTNSQSAHKIKKPSSFRSLYIDPNNHLAVFFLSPQGIVRSLDGGATWAFLNTLIQQGAGENANIKSFMVLPGSDNTYMFSLGRIIHKSVDGGNTWKTIENFPSGRNIVTLSVSPLAPDRIFAGTQEPPKKKGLFGF
ncbi:MAG: hypothetical protein KIH62_002265 [Candidatus Kerfeldbacteria bacterium]|nr:hypothetical protein [Candidatus Kerfeldbacteria bacterium]